MTLEQWINPETIALATQYSLRVIGALLLLFVGWTVAGWVRRGVETRLTKIEFDLTLTRFFSVIARYIVIILTVISCLRLFGVDTTSFAAVIAAGGLAIGLALQGSLSNFASGVMLLSFRPFKVGDVVEVAGKTGKVVGIELFTTKLDSPDNRRFIIPNSTIFNDVIENKSFHETRRVDVNVGTDYGAGLDETQALLERVAKAVPTGLEDPPVEVALLELGDSSISWQVRVWVNSADWWPTRKQLTRDVKVALDEAGIGIPFPQMDVHLDGKLGD